MKKISLILLLYILIPYLNGQTVSKDCYINGILVEAKTLLPISYAAIKILQQDSSLVYGVISDEQGAFCLSKAHVKYGKILRVEAIGYKSLNIDITQKLAMPLFLQLEVSTQRLQEIEISETQQGYKTKVDKTVIVPDSVMLKGAFNAVGLAKRIPLLKVDKSTQSISIQGSRNTLILINGNYSGANLNPANIMANNIERIEIVSNPSAQYDSEVGGVINIVTKREPEQGFSAFVFANYFLKNKQNTSNFRLSYHWKKISTFVEYRTRFSQVGVESRIYNKKKTNEGVFESFIDKPLEQPHLWEHKIYYGLEYRIDTRNLLSVDANYVIGDNQNTQHSTTRLYLNKVLQSKIRGNIDNNSAYHYQNYAIFFRHRFAKENHLLRLHLNGYFMKNDRDITNSCQYFEQGTWLQQTSRKKIVHYNNQSFRLRADYSLPFYKKWTLESGYHIYLRTLQNNSLIYDTQTFDYTDWRHAIYTQLNFEQGEWNIQAGIRSEGQQTSIINTKHNYWSFLPNFSILYKHKQHNIKTLYRRRLMYPYIGSLTPFVYYSADSLQINRGNPYLKASKTDKIEIKYTYQKPGKAFFTYSLYGQWMQDMIRPSYSTLSGGVLEVSAQNVGRAAKYGSFMSGYYALFNTFKFGAYYHFSYNAFPEKAYNGFSNQLSLSFDTQLPAGFQAGISYTMADREYNYRGWDYTYPLYDEIYISKEVFGGYGEFNISFLNVFKQEKDKSKTWDDNFYEISYNTYDSYKVMFSFSYFFKKGHTKRTQQKNNMLESDIGGEK